MTRSVIAVTAGVHHVMHATATSGFTVLEPNVTLQGYTYDLTVMDELPTHHVLPKQKAQWKQEQNRYRGKK